MKAAIIGSGIAGIASAIRLAVQGHDVSIYESNSYPGGKLSEFYLEGYRFDAGPSLFTMPHYVEELFSLSGKDINAYFSYEKLEIICKYFWEDHTTLQAFANKNDFANEVKSKLGVDQSIVDNILKDSQRKYDLCGKIFLENSLHKFKTWTKPEILKALIYTPSLDLFRSMNDFNVQEAKHPKLIQLFNRYATYNGSNPYKTPGLLTVIPHFEYNIGAFVPRGGMFSITKALVKLAQDIGVKFNFNSRVQKINIERKKISGIVVNNNIIAKDLVVSNMDIFHTYKRLLHDQKAPAKVLNQKKSSSALIFYWGVKRTFKELDVHNILFSEDYKKEFDCIEAGKVTEDPTVYINISKKYNSMDAPADCENWFVMINVPNNQGQDWESIIRKTRKNTIKKINRMLEIDIESIIECQEILDPRGIEAKTSSHLGALYGNSSDNKWAAFLRHANFSKRIKNLYFCGGSVHPGGGIPLALLSAKIVAQNLSTATFKKLS